jgi:hypothetical protein
MSIFDDSVPHKRAAAHGTELRLLALWTSSAKCLTSGETEECIRSEQTTSNIKEYLNQAVAETNDAFLLSGANLQIKLVHSEMINYKETSMLSDLTELTNSSGVFTHVHNLRSMHDAEVVTLVVGNVTSCGITWSINPPFTQADIDKLFSIVKWICAVGYYSLAHGKAEYNTPSFILRIF